jgi:hypothetical protein
VVNFKPPAGKHQSAAMFYRVDSSYFNTRLARQDFRLGAPSLFNNPPHNQRRREKGFTPPRTGVKKLR